MLHLPLTVKAWHQDDFGTTLRRELESLGPDSLPLQEALRHSSRLSEHPFSTMLIHRHEDSESLHLRVGVFYTGVIAGCSCADDPSPQDEVNEYCVLAFDIDKDSAQASVSLLDDEE